MLHIKKLYNSKILSLTISIIFLYSATLYSHPISEDFLRVPVGEIKSKRSALALKQYYNSRAENYTPDRKALYAAASIFGQAVPLDFIKGSKVLDLATGTGLIAGLAAQRGAMEVVGVDISEKMLDAAKKRLKNFSGADIRFIEGDLFNLAELFVGKEGYPDKFNIITIGNALTHYNHEDKNRILSQAFSLLEPGGYLVVLDYHLFAGFIESNMHYQISPERCVELLKDLGAIEANFYIANEETDEDLGIELSDLEALVKQNFVAWARKKPIEQKSAAFPIHFKDMAWTTGNTAQELYEKGLLTVSIKKNIISSLLSTAISLNGMAPKDFQPENFVIRDDTEDVVNVDLGKTRLHILDSKARFKKIKRHRFLFISFLMLNYGSLDNAEENYFIFEAIMEHKELQEGKALEFLRDVNGIVSNKAPAYRNQLAKFLYKKGGNHSKRLKTRKETLLFIDLISKSLGSYLPKAEARVLVMTIASRLKKELSRPDKYLEDPYILMEAIKKDPYFKDELDELNVRLTLDSLGRPWVFHEEAEIYLYIEDDKDRTVTSGRVEELIKTSSAKGLIRLLGVFADEDISEMVKGELLFRARNSQADPHSIIGSLVGALADPDLKCVKSAEELLFKISERHPDQVADTLVGALPDPKRAESAEKFLLKISERSAKDMRAVLKPLEGALGDPRTAMVARKILLKISKRAPGLIIDFLLGILKTEGKRGVQKTVTEMIESISRDAGYTVPSRLRKPGSKPGGRGGKRNRRPKDTGKGKGIRRDGKRQLKELLENI